MATVTFFVPGVPVPKGSGRPVPIRKGGVMVGTRVIQDNAERQKPWAASIGYHASRHFHGELLTGPVKLSIIFHMPRPKSHFGTGKNAGRLKDIAPSHHIIPPDMDKLIRCVKDALTKVVWVDDSQVCRFGDMGKQYGAIPGAHITIETL